MNLHIVNHQYHLDKIIDPSAKVLIIGNMPSHDPRVVASFPLFESCGVFSRLFARHVGPIFSLVRKINVNVVYFWGLQDRTSHKLADRLRDICELRVVPDNIEFFLRFESIKGNCFRAALKAFFYAESLNLLFGRTGSWCGRFVYPLPRYISISHDYAFYNLRSSEIVAPHSSGVTFISQPYNVDYGINEDSWLNVVSTILDTLKVEHGCVNIRFHQRDTLEFRRRILNLGFDEAVDEHYRVAGFFSTLLFENALKGRDTYILIDRLRGLLPDEYFEFSDWIISNLMEDFDSSQAIRFDTGAFERLPVCSN